TGGREDGDQQAQQEARSRQGRPARPIQDAMVVLKAVVVSPPHYAQTRGDGALANGQDGADQKKFGMSPNGFGKQRLELYDQRQQLDRQSLHSSPFLQERPVAYSACRLFFKQQIG